MDHHTHSVTILTMLRGVLRAARGALEELRSEEADSLEEFDLPAAVELALATLDPPPDRRSTDGEQD